MCLTPSLAFNVLKAKTRSIVFTSGTLKPFDAYQTRGNVNVPFPVRFTCGHVIDSGKQLSINIVPKLSLMNKPAEYTYGKRDEKDLQHHTGVFLGNCCATVPQGIVVFFPSYFVLNDYIKRWKTHGNGVIWKRMNQFKTVAVESRKKKDFKFEWKKFSLACTGRQPEFGQNNPQNGGIFLAVAGAKLSEGIDFTDGMARLVVMIGIPFKSSKAQSVKQKKDYLNRVIKEVKGYNNPLYQSGSSWYNSEAYRSINQAIGRVIRHNCDYGGIVLLDQRYNWSGKLEDISHWMRPHIFKCEHDKQALEILKRFYPQAIEFCNEKRKEFMSLQEALAKERGVDVDLKRNSPTQLSDDIEDSEDGIEVSIGTKLTIDNEQNYIEKSSKMAQINFGMTDEEVKQAAIQDLLDKKGLVDSIRLSEDTQRVVQDQNVFLQAIRERQQKETE